MTGEGRDRGVARTDDRDHARSFQLLTDATKLDVDAHLDEMLDHIRDTLRADTATILLLEPAAEELVVWAARGLEEESYQDTRVPLGKGFAGRIAAENRPILLDRVDETTVVSPLLYEMGIRRMLGVPLLDGDDVIGVVHVGRMSGVPFTDADKDLLVLVAERFGFATQALLLEAERAATKVLERSLLPRVLPNCPGLEIAVRYVSAEARYVGGDWYDMFELPSGELWLTVGDVAGHGLSAAIVMGRLRNTVRSYALLGPACDRVIDLTNRKFMHFEAGQTATIVCACSVPPYDSFRICSAGHPPPIICRPGEAPSPLPLTPRPLLGVSTDYKPPSVEVPFHPGTLLVFYTDGLIERRDESIDVGVQRLCDAIPHDMHPQAVCQLLMRVFIGTSPPRDDVALVAIRRVAA